jgi:hypothetical protein
MLISQAYSTRNGSTIMAKGRVRNRLQLREEYEAAEAREQEQSTQGEEAGDEGEASEEGTAVKKRKKKAPSTEPKPKRSRAAKVVRQRVVWIVFDNAHKPIQTFEYPRRQEAEDLATRLATDKKSTYFVQPVKEDLKD